MMPHTPGPWKAKLGRTLAFDCSIVTEEGFIVARTSESNGPLIAAAPDLLQACQAVMKAFEAFKAEARFSGEDECITLARAAIAKAEEY